MDPSNSGESVDVTFSAEQFNELKTGLINNDYPLSFHYVNVRIDAVVFADRQLWYKGGIFYRDPVNPNRFIRDKSGANIKPTP